MNIKEFNDIKKDAILELSSMFPLNHRVQHIVSRLKRLEPITLSTCATCNNFAESYGSFDNVCKKGYGTVYSLKQSCVEHSDYER